VEKSGLKNSSPENGSTLPVFRIEISGRLTESAKADVHAFLAKGKQAEERSG